MGMFIGIIWKWELLIYRRFIGRLLEAVNEELFNHLNRFYISHYLSDDFSFL